MGDGSPDADPNSDSDPVDDDARHKNVPTLDLRPDDARSSGERPNYPADDAAAETPDTLSDAIDRVKDPDIKRLMREAAEEEPTDTMTDDGPDEDDTADGDELTTAAVAETDDDVPGGTFVRLGEGEGEGEGDEDDDQPDPESDDPRERARAVNPVDRHDTQFTVKGEDADPEGKTAEDIFTEEGAEDPDEFFEDTHYADDWEPPINPNDGREKVPLDDQPNAPDMATDDTDTMSTDAHNTDTDPDDENKNKNENENENASADENEQELSQEDARDYYRDIDPDDVADYADSADSPDPRDGPPVDPTAEDFDPESFDWENQEFEVGEAKDDKYLHFKNGIIWLRQPDDDEFLNFIQTMQDMPIEERFEAIVANTVHRPHNIYSLLEEMTAVERTTLVGECVQYLGLDQLEDF